MAKPEPAQLDAWRALSATHTRLNAALDTSLRAERGLTLSQFEVLDMLVVNGGRLGTTELAAALGSNQSSLTRRIDKLEGDELLKRLRSKDDARYVTVAITKDGRDTHRTASTTWRRTLQREWAQYLSDNEVAALSKIAAKLAAD